jgi:indole-3-glycerol phosphate synthase
MILDDIVENRRREVEDAKKLGLIDKLAELAEQRIEYIDFGSMLSRDPERVKIIAEVKKASPSKGVLREDFDPVEIARSYDQGGADALSVLTEKKHFQGDIEYIRDIKKNDVNLPILCKDFFIDKFQIVQAAAYGADAILLIAAVLSDKDLEDFCAFCGTMDLFCIAEVHDEKELERVSSLEKAAIQINNRDLRTFEVDLGTTERLINHVPAGRKVISASGVRTREDIEHLREHGVDAVLIGETFMREDDIQTKLRELRA